MPAEPEVLLENRRQAIKVRLVFWAMLVAAALAAWGGWSIFESYGLSPGDGGVLRPLWQRLALGIFVAGLGFAAAGGMALYLSLYALGIERRGDRVTITTMTAFGRRHREFALCELGESAYHHGRIGHVTPSGGSAGLWVNAPWITLRAAGRRFPFIIDLQAETINIGALSVLAEGGVQDWQGDTG